jgi:hypothetical protein
MSLIKNPVRVRLPDGQESTESAEYAAAKGLEVLKGARAVDRAGRGLPPSSQLPGATIGAAIDADVAALKGPALNEALDAAGLPKGGSAAEKRQRLADQRAASANLPDEPPPGGSGNDTEGTDKP